MTRLTLMRAPPTYVWAVVAVAVGVALRTVFAPTVFAALSARWRYPPPRQD